MQPPPSEARETSASCGHDHHPDACARKDRAPTTPQFATDSIRRPNPDHPFARTTKHWEVLQLARFSLGDVPRERPSAGFHSLRSIMGIRSPREGVAVSVSCGKVAFGRPADDETETSSKGIWWTLLCGSWHRTRALGLLPCPQAREASLMLIARTRLLDAGRGRRVATQRRFVPDPLAHGRWPAKRDR